MPIINNIIGDTSEFVKRYNVGINVSEDTVLDFDEIKKMRINNENIYKLYENNFKSDVFIKRCKEVIDEVNSIDVHL